MLLLVTILLVVVGTISLVIGYVQSSLVPIYVSIGCSVIAGAVLLIFSRMTSRSRPTPASDEGPAPFSAGSSGTEPVPAMAGGGFLGRSSSGDAFAPAAGAPSRYAADDHAEDDNDKDDDDKDGDKDAAEGDGAAAGFPIDRYDSRRVGEILPLLADLDVDELDLVREREERGKGRATLLARIDQLIEQLEEEDRHEADHRFDAPVAGRDDDDYDDVDGPAAPPTVSQPVSVGALPDDDGYFPIEEYDDLRASEILPLLPELDDDELEMVRQRERSGSARSSIMHRIEALLEPEPAAVGPGPVPAPDGIGDMQDDEDDDDEDEDEVAPVVSETVMEPPARRERATRPSGGRTAKAPAVKAPAVKAPAGKAPRAVKAPAVKAPAAKAPRAVKVPAAKAPAVKVPAVKVPAAKAPRAVKAAAASAARAPAKAAPAAAVSKAATKRAAPARTAPVARTPAAKAPAAKAPVDKAAPAKRAAQKRTANPSSTPASKSTRKAAKR